MVYTTPSPDRWGGIVGNMDTLNVRGTHGLLHTYAYVVCTAGREGGVERDEVQREGMERQT